MKRPMILVVRGQSEQWVFKFRGDPTCIDDWRADGLEVYPVEAAIPFWLAGTVLAGLGLAIQRAWQWVRLW